MEQRQSVGNIPRRQVKPAQLEKAADRIRVFAAEALSIDFHRLLERREGPAMLPIILYSRPRLISSTDFRVLGTKDLAANVQNALTQRQGLFEVAHAPVPYRQVVETHGALGCSGPTLFLSIATLRSWSDTAVA